VTGRLGRIRWPLVVAALAAIAVSALVVTRLSAGRAPDEEGYSLADASPEVASSYRFIADHREHAERIPCYCGCESLEHRHLLDCFVKPDGGWEAHATGCQVCRDEAADLQEMLAAGLDIEEIRVRIDEKYASLGKPTKTP